VDRQKVVSVSLFGSSRKYLAGSEKLAMSVNRNLPGWNMVFFLGDSVSQKYRTRLVEHGAKIVSVSEKEDLTATAWRFRLDQLGAPTWVIFRDADSVVTKREASAVTEWIESDYKAHIIRDHPFHSSSILAGLWGIKPEAFTWFQRAVEDYSFDNSYGSDQNFLNAHVYPRILDSTMVHASFHQHEAVNQTRNFKVGSSRIGVFCGDAATERWPVRAYARLRRLVDSKSCSCGRSSYLKH
jgi:hypothetical protein